MPRTVITAALVLALALGGVPPSWSQRATEVFIPIGESPGMSGITTVIGEIAAVDTVARTLTVRGESGEVTARITDETSIWLDRSTAKRTNGKGSPIDCKIGRMSEVHFVYDGERRTDEAKWIKVRVSE